MPRYYFDTLHDRNHFDEEGEILPDDDMAREVAVRLVSELAGTRTSSIWAGEAFQIVVRDDTRQTVGTLTVAGDWPGR